MKDLAIPSPELLYFISILGGILFVSPLWNYFENPGKKFIDVILGILLSIGAVLLFLIGTYLVEEIQNDEGNVAELLAPIGILLSAFIASSSLIKSIQNTKNLEQEKQKEEKQKQKMKLLAYLARLEISCMTFKKILKRQAPVIQKTLENISIHLDDEIKILRNSDIFHYLENNEERTKLARLLSEIIDVQNALSIESSTLGLTDVSDRLEKLKAKVKETKKFISFKSAE